MIPTKADQTYLSGLTVLYVEDDPQVQAATARFIRRRVGRLCVAGDGVEGLETFRQERPHILVTDIMMPRMDGLALAEALKEEVPDLPVVVITAFEQTQFLLRSITLGVDRYVLKPVDPERLEAALLHCAHQLRAEEELRQHLRLERELMLARQHESLCILAQGMAHDYNNLLQAILTCVYTAEGHTEPGSPAHAILSMAERFAGVAKNLGQQLLTLGQVCDQLDQVGSLEILFEPALQEFPVSSGIAVTLHFPAGLPPIRYNRERLGQAIAALLTNAREAMPQGGILQIEATLEDVGPGSTDLSLHPGRYLRLDLKDSGLGIPKDLLPRIFDPYFSSKERGSQKGQGLSLAICRSILLAHGGQVTAESEVGQGSTFHVYLPVAPDTSGPSDH